MHLLGPLILTFLSLIALAAQPCAAEPCLPGMQARVKFLDVRDQKATKAAMRGPDGIRGASKAALKRIELFDAESETFIKLVLQRCGWPEKSVFGEEAVGRFGTLVVHATSNPALQRYARHLMEEQLSLGQINRQQFALLTDKILVADKKLQRYGTQLDMDFNLQPLEDPAAVDQLRAEMGLIPLQEYVQMVRTFYGQAKPPAGK